MVDDRRPRERELVLAPNEYAYVLDTTKGHINCYVGPNKTSLAQTDQPVRFNNQNKRFESAELSDAILLFATAPANWYIVLKNPSKNPSADNSHPRPGMSNSSIDLHVGRKVNVCGPCSFALWPGQMVRVIEGHRLKSNQYLVIRVYDADEAKKNWRAALGIPEEAHSEGEAPKFVVGEKRIIKGTDVSFYIPPTGIEVVPSENNNYINDAVTLQRLEYCVLVGEDGRKKYVRGEAVVFPEPNQMFLEKEGNRSFRAIELSEISGLYIKVIAPYIDEHGVEHIEGEELFLTGSNKLYFPREEHAIIRYTEQELHHAIAIPPGEGRYVLSRRSGEIGLRHGPCMLLPDPRNEVVVRRILSDREVRLIYPNNDEALAYNRALRSTLESNRLIENASGGILPAAPPAMAAQSASVGAGVRSRDMVQKEAAAAPARFEGDSFSRKQKFSPPRTITLDTKYDGAVSSSIWSGYAVQVVNKKGERRVVIGPATVLLEYDETFEVLSLSTGTPKSADHLLQTVFLQVNGNQVSDRIEVLTHDLVRASVLVKYRVNFEGGDASRWFSVDNYVKLLCDHASSIVKSVSRQVTIRDLRVNITDHVRDAILGKKAEGEDRRGLFFKENNMRIYDVEVLDLDIVDGDVEDLLAKAQLDSIRRAISVAEKESMLSSQLRIEEIDRQLAAESQRSQMLTLELNAVRDAKNHELEKARRDRASMLEQLAQAMRLEAAQAEARIRGEQLTVDEKVRDAERRHKTELQALELALLQAKVKGTVEQAQAYSPELVAALNRLGDAQVLTNMADNFGGLAAVEGKSLLETARKFLDFVPSSLTPVLRSDKS